MATGCTWVHLRSWGIKRKLPPNRLPLGLWHGLSCERGCSLLGPLGAPRGVLERSGGFARDHRCMAALGHHGICGGSAVTTVLLFPLALGPSALLLQC